MDYGTQVNVSIAMDADGHARLTLNGVDISSRTTGYTVTSEAGGATRLTLVMEPSSLTLELGGMQNAAVTGGEAYLDADETGPTRRELLAMLEQVAVERQRSAWRPATGEPRVGDRPY